MALEWSASLGRIHQAAQPEFAQPLLRLVEPRRPQADAGGAGELIGRRFLAVLRSQVHADDGVRPKPHEDVGVGPGDLAIGVDGGAVQLVPAARTRRARVLALTPS